MKLLYNYDLDVYALAPDYNEAHFQKLKKNNINFLNYKLNRSSINPFINIINFFELVFSYKKK